MIGPGKYDDLCTAAREAAGPVAGVILIVVGGERGSGFSAQGTLEFQAAIPQVLESVAAEIRRDVHGVLS